VAALDHKRTRLTPSTPSWSEELMGDVSQKPIVGIALVVADEGEDARLFAADVQEKVFVIPIFEDEAF
jgi:hypothetical protein